MTESPAPLGTSLPETADEICGKLLTGAGDGKHVCYRDKGHDGEHVCMGCAEQSVVAQTHAQNWGER